MSYSKQIVRIKSTDNNRFGNIIDIVTSKPLRLFVNEEVSIEVSVYNAKTSVPEDLTNVSSAIFELKNLSNGGVPVSSASAVLSSTTSSIDNTLTDATWLNRSKKHFAFSFSDTNMNITPNDYWCSCYMTLSSGAHIIIFAGKITLTNPGTTAGL